MNYYEHHIGDYAAATAHLSLVEDAIYSRLLRRYYLQEEPLPADVKQVARLSGARSPEEIEAVQVVLDEFFALESDGWHNKRADEEIARYQEKQAKARASATARWAKPSNSERNANAMRTHNEGNAHQTPDTRHQTEAKKEQAAAAPAALACKAMKAAGCVGVNPAHPHLLAALDEGVTPEALAATVAEANEQGIAKPFAWAIATARGRHRDGARPPPVARAGPAAYAPSKTLTAIQTLQGMKHGNLDSQRDSGRADQVALLESGTHPRG